MLVKAIFCGVPCKLSHRISSVSGAASLNIEIHVPSHCEGETTVIDSTVSIPDRHQWLNPVSQWRCLDTYRNRADD